MEDQSFIGEQQLFHIGQAGNRSHVFAATSGQRGMQLLLPANEVFGDRQTFAATLGDNLEVTGVGREEALDELHRLRPFPVDLLIPNGA